MTSGHGANEGREDRRRELVDTRDPSGPEGRTYTVPFAGVWDAVADEIRSQRRWELVHADEERGLFTVVCRSFLRRSVDDLSIWIHLDEYGLTRLDVRAGARQRSRGSGANRRRVDDLLRAVDEALGPDARIVGPGDSARD